MRDTLANSLIMFAASCTAFLGLRPDGGVLVVEERVLCASVDS